MAWLSRINFTAADVLSYASLNNLGNDIRAWGGPVNGGGFTLSNCVFGTGISIVAPTVVAPFTVNSSGGAALFAVANAGKVAIGGSGTGATLTVSGIASAPTLVHGAAGVTTWNYGAVGTELALTHQSTAPFPICFQGRSANADGSTAPVVLNPLGGNVGIGNANPLYALDVSGRLHVGPDGTASPTKTTPEVNISISKLDSSGTPSINKIALYNAGGFAAGFGVGVSSLDLVTGPGYIRFYTGATVADGTGAALVATVTTGSFLVGYAGSQGVWPLQVNGQIFATSSTIATSDANYKQDVQPLKDALLLVNALNPVSFNWKEHHTHKFDLENGQIGFVAQEVEKVLGQESYCNSIVKRSVCKYEDAEGKEIEEPFLGIAEGNLIALLTAAIQEITVRLLKLEAKIQ